MNGSSILSCKDSKITEREMLDMLRVPAGSVGGQDKR